MGIDKLMEYILIKEYPGSPELGTIIKVFNNEVGLNSYGKYPEFWEPIRYYKLISQTRDGVGWTEDNGALMQIGRIVSSLEEICGHPMSYWIDGQERYWQEIDKPKDFVIVTKRIPLFTTSDGVDFYEGDKIYYVGRLFNTGQRTVGKYSTSTKDHPVEHWNMDDKYFSSEEKAMDYVMVNKPCLSVKEVAPIFGKYYLNDSSNVLEKISKALTDIVKSKI